MISNIMEKRRQLKDHLKEIDDKLLEYKNTKEWIQHQIGTTM